MSILILFVSTLLFCLTQSSPTSQLEQTQENAEMQRILAHDLKFDLKLSIQEIDEIQKSPMDDLVCSECLGIMGYSLDGTLLDLYNPECFQYQNIIPMKSEDSSVNKRLNSEGKASTTLTSYCVTVRARVGLNFLELALPSSCSGVYCVEYIGRGRVTVNDTLVTGSTSSDSSLLNGVCWADQPSTNNAIGSLLNLWRRAFDNIKLNNQTAMAYMWDDDLETCYCNDRNECNERPTYPNFKRQYGKWVEQPDEQPGVTTTTTEPNVGTIIQNQNFLLIISALFFYSNIFL